MKKSLIALSVVASLAMADGSYTLGRVSIAATNADDINMIEKTIKTDDIDRDSSITISEALDNINGVSQDLQGGRAEGTLHIRGFNARRIGVFIDGIPISVPYDGNFDYDRFLTSDVGQIDVSKGYSSTSYGGNTMGGVVNIVSKKPTKEFEGNIKGTMVLDSNAKLARHIESINVGSMINGFYAQLGAVYSKKDHFRLSNDFKAVDDQPRGDRLRSESEDKKISLKLGFVANDMSEIAISYSNQQGEKQQPPVTDDDFARVKYWDWPEWDKETISISGLKNFGNSYIKALAYYDKSENTLYSYDDITYSTFNNNSSFKSPLEDYSYGARVEYGLESGGNFLKLSANYKKDFHKKFDLDKSTGASSLDEEFKQHTFSVGIEDSYKINDSFEILAGISFDQLEGDYVYKPGAYQGLDTISAWNPQAALIYTINPQSKVRISISQKTYLPNMKDRYSGGLGTKVANPGLDKELSTHYEIGYTYQTKKLLASANAYYTKVEDAIQGVNSTETYTKKGKTYFKEQNQNIGEFDHYGFELEVDYKLEKTQIGANYSYIDIKNQTSSKDEITSVPKNQIFAFVKQEVGAGFSLYANMKFREGAYEQKMNDSYVTIPSFTTFDFKVMYSPIEELIAEVGVKNLTDKLYSYNMGYPMAGREYFATLNYKF